MQDEVIQEQLSIEDHKNNKKYLVATPFEEGSKTCPTLTQL